MLYSVIAWEYSSVPALLHVVWKWIIINPNAHSHGWDQNAYVPLISKVLEMFIEGSSVQMFIILVKGKGKADDES